MARTRRTAAPDASATESGAVPPAGTVETFGSSETPPAAPEPTQERKPTAPTPGRVVLYRYRESDGCRHGAVGELRPARVVTVHPDQFTSPHANNEPYVMFDGYGVRVDTTPNDFDDGRASFWVGDAAHGMGNGEIHYPPRA